MNRSGSLSWSDLPRLAGMVVAVLICAILVSTNEADPDLWGHWQYGRDLLREGLPRTTTYSFTAEGYPWVNHENLAELALALGMDGIGQQWVLAIKCALGLLILWLIARSAWRDGTRDLLLALTVVVVAANLQYFFCLRPQVFTFVCFALMLAVMGRAFRGWEGRCWLPWFDRLSEKGSDPLEAAHFSRNAGAAGEGQTPVWTGSDRAAGDEQTEPARCLPHLNYLWLAPLVQVVAVNSHGGFAAVYGVTAAYLVLRGVEAVWRWRWASPEIVVRLAAVLAATTLALLVNPYGIGLPLWMSRALGVPRPEIADWRPPDMFSSVMVPFWASLGIFAFGLLFTRRSRDFTHVAVLVLLLWQSLEHVRHIPFFAMAVGFWVSGHLQSAWDRLLAAIPRLALRRSAATAGDPPLRETRALRPSHARAAVLFACSAAIMLTLKLERNLRGVTLLRSEYPVAAFQYIAEKNLEGKLVVNYGWAQYAIAAFSADRPTGRGIRVAFDGRFRTCYPQEIIDMNLDFLLPDANRRYRSPRSGSMDRRRVLQHLQPDLVLIAREQYWSSNTLFRESRDWTLLYQDGLAQLWGRRDQFDNPSSSTYLPPEQRVIGSAPQFGRAAWPALPTRAGV